MKAKIYSVYSKSNYSSTEAQQIIKYMRLLTLAWTILVGFSCWNSYREHNNAVERIALAQARATIGRDILYRRWGSMHGGVYVPPTATTPPNRYLANIPLRDVVTTEGKKLTLINPAYMIRQIYELEQQDGSELGVGHLTSLKPLRPENGPDAWERNALKAFETGIKEVSQIVEHRGKSYLRLMKPFMTEQSCLKCHAQQGYKLGEVRGGLNISIPIQPLVDATQNEIYGSIGRHIAVWILGLLFFITGTAKLSRSAQTQQESQDELCMQAEQLEEEIAERQQAQEELQNQAAILEEEIAERQAAQESLQEQATILEEEITERQQAEEALLEKTIQLEVLNHTLEVRVSQNVTELRQKDQILIQQGRLAAMGEMINNIAHQWRQPLNNVGLLIQNLQFAFKEGQLTEKEMDNAIEKAMKTIIYMSHTIDDFRNFFRHDKEKELFLIHNIINKTLHFIGATLESQGIIVKCQFSETTSATGYPNEYAQVILNILSNARDALIERKIKNPEISIVVADNDDISVVSIRDNAGGIENHILPRIFDPYFTTKEPGKGTGIGLYMSKIIIEQNMGGKLTANNLPDGVEFIIQL